VLSPGFLLGLSCHAISFDVKLPNVPVSSFVSCANLYRLVLCIFALNLSSYLVRLHGCEMLRGIICSFSFADYS
jgi:hypothetical protein